MASRESGHAHIRISPETKRFAGELRSQLQKVNVNYEVDVRPDTDRFDTELRARLAAMRHEVEVDVTADTTRYDAEMGAATAPGRYEASINVDADTARADAQIDAAARDRTATIHTRVEGGASRSLGLIEKRLGDIGDRAGGVTSALSELGDKGGDALTALGSAAVDANRGMGTLRGGAASTLRTVDRGASTATRSVAGFGSAAARTGGTMRRMVTTVGLLGTAVSVLGVGIAGLVPVTFSAGAAIGQFAISTGAALGAVALPAVTGLGLAFAALKMSTSGMGAAISGEAEEAADALAELSEPMQKAALSLRDLRDGFVGFGDVVSGDFWTEFNNIGELGSLINPVKNAMTTIAAETGNATRGLVAFVSAGAGLMATEDLLHGAGRATGQLAQATMNVVEGLISIGGAAAPVYVDMLRGLSGVTAGWSRNLSLMYQTGELHERIREHAENMRAGWDTFTGAMSTTGGIISGVWSAVEGSGNAAYDAVARVFNETNAWVNSMAGQSTLRDFFADAQDVAVGLMGTVGQLLGVIGTLTPAIADAMTQFGPGMRQLIDGLETGLSAIVPHVGGVAAGIGTLAGALSPLLPLVGELAGSLLSVAGPALEGMASVLTLLTPLVEGVTAAVGAMPAPIAAMAAAWLAMKVIPSGVLAPITKATTGITTAAGKAKGAVTGFGESMRLQSSLALGLGKNLTTTQSAMAALQTNVPAIGRMSEAFRQASHNGRTLGQVAVVAGQSVGGLRGNMLVAQGAALKFGATMQGVAAGGLSAMRSGASGLIDALGGPWGAAMLGASLAIGAVVSAAGEAGSAQQRLAEAASNARAAQEALTMAAAGTTGALGEAGLAAAADLAAARLETMRVHSEMGALSLSRAWKGWDDVLSGTGKSLGEVSVESNNATRAGKALESAMQETGMSVEDVNRAVAEGGSGYTELIRSLEGMGTAGELAIIELAGTRGEIQANIEAAQRLPENYGAIAGAIDILADSSSSAEDRLNALRTILDQMGGGTMSQQEALKQAAEHVDEIANSASLAVDPLAGLGAELFGLDDQLKMSNPNARALHDELGDLRDQFLQLSESGVAPKEALEQLQPVMDKLIEDFDLAPDQVERLREQFGLMPDRVETLLALEGGDTAAQDISKVWGLLESHPDDKRVNIGVVSDEAVAALDALGLKVDTVIGPDGRPVEMFVTANTEDGRAKLAEFADIAANLGTADINPTVWLDTTPLQFSKVEAEGLLADLEYNDPTPEADLIIDKLLAGQDVSMGELATLAGQTADPGAILRNEELLNKKDVSSNELTALHNQKTDPKVTAEKSVFDKVIGSVMASLSGLPPVKLIKIVAEKLGFNFGGLFGGRATGGLFNGPAYATGGQFGLPAYATGQRHNGYQLPTTGPGTHEVDGFLGLQADGTPAAWLDAGEWIINRKSSKKYHNELRAINAGTFPKIDGYATGGQYGGDDRDDYASTRSTGTSAAGREPMNGANILRWVGGETMFGVRPPGGMSLEGSSYVWGGGSPENWGDCSGSMSLIAGLIAGKWFNETMRRLFATGSQEATLKSMGWTMGAAPRSRGVFELGWFNGGPYGGHTSGTLDGTNVEMGGGRGNGQIGGGAAPASHSQYTNRAWIELPDGEDLRADGADYYGDYYGDDYGDGGDDTRSASDYVYGTDSRSGGSVDKRDDYDPTKADTWSDAAGDVAHTAVSGQFKDAFDVLGLPDELPPALRAAREAREMDEERRNPGSTTKGKSGTTKARDPEKDRQKAADLDQKIEYAEDELAIAKTRRDETYNKTDSKGNKSATDSQKQQADLQVKKAEDKLEKAKREREEFERERAGDAADRGRDGDRDRNTDPSDEVVYRPGGGAEQWRPVVAAGLRRMGLSESAVGITLQQIDIESGGDPNARNGWDINAKNGDPSIGLLQVIRSTFTSMRRLFPEANDGLPDDQAHPLANIVAALGWTVHKYGGPEKIWPTRAGYASGGRVWGAGGPKDDKIPAMLSDGEFVVNSEATSRNLPVLERINSGMPLPAAARADGDLSPGVRNFRIAPTMRRHFATGGLVGSLVGGIDMAKLMGEIGSKAVGAGVSVLNGAVAGATGGAAPGGDGTLEGEIVRRAAGAAHATTGHLAGFAREMGGALVNDLVGSAFVGAPDTAIGDMLAAADHQVRAAQNIRAATPQTVTTTTTNGGSEVTNWTIHAADTRDGLKAAKLQDWRNKALTHAGGRR